MFGSLHLAANVVSLSRTLRIVGRVCIFSDRTFVPSSWLCKKQTTVSHNSAEAEVISLDTGCAYGRFTSFDVVDCVFDCLAPDLSASGNHVRLSVPLTYSTAKHSQLFPAGREGDFGGNHVFSPRSAFLRARAAHHERDP